jgi:hypothetical protein
VREENKINPQDSFSVSILLAHINEIGIEALIDDIKFFEKISSEQSLQIEEPKLLIPIFKAFHIIETLEVYSTQNPTFKKDKFIKLALDFIAEKLVYLDIKVTSKSKSLSIADEENLKAQLYNSIFLTLFKRISNFRNSDQIMLELTRSLNYMSKNLPNYDFNFSNIFGGRESITNTSAVISGIVTAVVMIYSPVFIFENFDTRNLPLILQHPIIQSALSGLFLGGLTNFAITAVENAIKNTSDLFKLRKENLSLFNSIRKKIKSLSQMSNTTSDRSCLIYL